MCSRSPVIEPPEKPGYLEEKLFHRDGYEGETMDSERRRWCCPLCSQVYWIPVSFDDPMACPRCTGEAESANIWVPASTVPAAEVDAQSDSVDEWLGQRLGDAPGSAAFPDREPQQFKPSHSAVASAAPPLSQRPARRQKGRAVALAAGGLLATAALIALFLFRPYSLREILVRPPEVRGNPNENAPLAAVVKFSTHLPAVAAIEVRDGEREWTVRPDGPPRTEHRLAVVGLRPDRTHQIRVQVESYDGWFVETSDPLPLVTPPLPDDFPPIRTVLSRPGKMEPGVTLFAVNRWWEGERDSNYGYIMMLDGRGEVIWYFRAGRGTADMRLLRNGRLLCNDTNYRQVYEVDLLGNVHREWHTTGAPDPPKDGAIPVEADTLHHEVIELPSGNFLALSTELRSLEEFPASEVDPDVPAAPANVVADLILEFQPDGRVVRRWKLLDLLDPQRIGYGSLTEFWTKKYDHRLDGETEDWSHANAIIYDARDDSMIVSVRHQDCLVKIDRRSGRIAWILGDHGNWREPWSHHLLQPKGDLEWPYHQHGPQLTPAGTILMYDNGNYRALPFDPPTPAPENYSRVVEFRVDEVARTVEQVWEYRGSEEDSFYSPFYCEADWLPRTGNILITDGGRIELADGTPADLIPSDHQWARILEVTHAQPAEKLFEVVIDSGLESPQGWSVYRSERLAGLEALSDLATAALNEQ